MGDLPLPRLFRMEEYENLIIFTRTPLDGGITFREGKKIRFSSTVFFIDALEHRDFLHDLKYPSPSSEGGCFLIPPCQESFFYFLGNQMGGFPL